MTDGRIEMPDDYTEMTYDDGEMSGSGNRRFTQRDFGIVAQWTVGIVGGLATLGGLSYGVYKVQPYVKMGVSAAWNYIADCCSPSDDDYSQWWSDGPPRPSEHMSDISSTDLSGLEILEDVLTDEQVLEIIKSTDKQTGLDAILQTARKFATAYDVVNTMPFGPFEDNQDAYRAQDVVDMNGNLMSKERLNNLVVVQLDVYMKHGGDLWQCQQIYGGYVPLAERLNGGNNNIIPR